MWDYPEEHLVVIKDEQVFLLVKFEIILPLLCCLWTSLQISTAEHFQDLSKVQSPAISKAKLLKENVFGDMMLSQWPCFTWKFFMLWFHKILKLVFQNQPSCPRNIALKTLKRNIYFDFSVEHVLKVLLIGLFIHLSLK